MKFFAYTSTFLIAIIGLSSPLLAKRHSHINKIERFEQRAQAAAKAHSPLAAALGKQTKHMSYEQALLAQEYYRNVNQPDMVLKTGERILAVGGNQTIPGVQEVMRKTRIEIAELSLNNKKYEDAERHAQDYLTFYPGSYESKKASYISLSAAHRSQLHSQRDQQKTLDTIERSDRFLEKYPLDTEYRPAVEQIRHKSYLKLIRSELNIMGTQLNNFHYANSPASLDSAEKRLLHLKEKFLPNAPEARRRVLETELVIAHARADQERINKVQQELASLPPQKTPPVQTIYPTWQTVKHYFNEDNESYFS